MLLPACFSLSSSFLCLFRILPVFFLFTSSYFLLRFYVVLVCSIFGSIERNSVQFIELRKKMPAVSSFSTDSDSDSNSVCLWFPVATLRVFWPFALFSVLVFPPISIKCFFFSFFLHFFSCTFHKALFFFWIAKYY